MALKLHNHKSLEMNIIQMSSDEILMYVMSYIRFECDVLTIFFVCFSLSVCLPLFHFLSLSFCYSFHAVEFEEICFQMKWKSSSSSSSLAVLIQYGTNEKASRELRNMLLSHIYTIREIHWYTWIVVSMQHIDINCITRSNAIEMVNFYIPAVFWTERMTH